MISENATSENATSENLILAPRATRSDRPEVRSITPADLKDALRKGLADFNAMPTHLVFLVIIYPIVTFAIAGFYGQLRLLPLVFPLLAGYMLVGPLVATGMYELSRRREFGRLTSRANAFLVFRSHSIVAIGILGVLLMVVYFAWLFAAQAIYELNFGGAAPDSYTAFAIQVATTPAGWKMIAQGCGIGFIFAVIVLSLSVVSFPMLLDLDVSVATAIKTSVRAVLLNWPVMALWGVIVSILLFLGSLPFFVGLAVVLPVIGHSTWHLYRKVVIS